MRYDEAGTGTPLLLIHGFPHDRSLWKPQLEGLPQDARVIAPDLRGFGAWPDDSAVLPMERHASDLRDLLDHLRIDRAVVCGLSMGGYVALAFAAAFLERLQGLILCGTRAGADNEEGRTNRKATADRALKEGVNGLADELAPKMLSSATRTSRPGLVADVRTMLARQRPQAYAAAALGMAERADRTAGLPAIAVPALVITGQDDEMIPARESHALASAIPNSSLVVVPSVGHLSNLEAPQDFNKAVRDFIRSLPRQH